MHPPAPPVPSTAGAAGAGAFVGRQGTTPSIFASRFPTAQSEPVQPEAPEMGVGLLGRTRGQGHGIGYLIILINYSFCIAHVFLIFRTFWNYVLINSVV